jgi:hypothetical protein
MNFVKLRVNICITLLYFEDFHYEEQWGGERLKQVNKIQISFSSFPQWRENFSSFFGIEGSEKAKSKTLLFNQKSNPKSISASNVLCIKAYKMRNHWNFPPGPVFVLKMCWKAYELQHQTATNMETVFGIKTSLLDPIFTLFDSERLLFFVKRTGESIV